MVTATTGKAAAGIRGSTVFSYTHGACIPCGNFGFNNLKHQSLMKFQERLEDIIAIVVDELSMLDAKSLYMLDQRLRQAKNSNLIFGGIVVLLCGDTAQLPPVNGTPLWGPSTTNSSQYVRDGVSLFTQFQTCTILTESNRLNKLDSEFNQFSNLLQELRDGNVSKNTWEYLKSNNTLSYVGEFNWKKRGFRSNNCVHLYCTNDKVNRRNKEVLVRSSNPIVKIESVNKPKKAMNDSGENCRQLPKKLFISRGSIAMLLWNVRTEYGLVNGATGTVKEIIYAINSCPPSLPEFVIVDFGDKYKGPVYFTTPSGETSRNNWVPIFPVTAKWKLDSQLDHSSAMPLDEYSRSMLPFRLSYAWTIWKAQGMTIEDPILIDLEEKERSHGLTYTAFSRARCLRQIGLIGGISFKRLQSFTTYKMFKDRLIADEKLKQIERKNIKWRQFFDADNDKEKYDFDIIIN